MKVNRNPSCNFIKLHKSKCSKVIPLHLKNKVYKNTIRFWHTLRIPSWWVNFDFFTAVMLFQGHSEYIKLRIHLTLQEGGAFKAPPEQNMQFKHLLVIQLSRKNLTFPRTLWGCLHILLGAQNCQKTKKWFLKHFCRWRQQFPD